MQKHYKVSARENAVFSSLHCDRAPPLSPLEQYKVKVIKNSRLSPTCP